MKNESILILIGLLIFGLFPWMLQGQNKTIAGNLTIEPPTLICLGFDWKIEGDDNMNASVEVRYRKKGETEWNNYLSLFRTGRGRTVDYGFGNFDDPNHQMRYRIPDGFAGSIMDLEPGTFYEVQLKLIDPDGVKGDAVKNLELKTRSEPVQYEGGEVRHVYPPDFKGEKQQPAYNNLMHAVNGFQTWCDNYQTIHPNKAKPGTKILVHAGIYKTDYHDYRDPGGLWLHGMQTFVAGGEPEKPIMIVSAGDGEVIFDGNGSDRYFNIAAADYMYFEGITIRNTRIAFYCGLQGLQACTGLTVKNCRMEQVQYGILAQDARSENFYIADNVFIGRNPSDRFNPKSGGAYGRTDAGYAVNLAGKGHVVGYNYVANFWDGINVFTNSLADPALNQQSRAIDIYNNDIFNINDNFIEADGGYANIRILRNRCFNSMAAPISVQPVYSGPVYWIRNVVYNAHRGMQALKLVDGDNVIFYHNTITCHWSDFGGCDYGDIRNNLFMGPDYLVSERDARRDPKILKIGFTDKRSRFNSNAIRTGMKVENPFNVKFPDVQKSFDSLSEIYKNTGLLENFVEVTDYSIFLSAEEPDHAPSNMGRLYNPENVDLRLKNDAPVINRGSLIAGINDCFSGEAPDLGAYEYGAEIPHYGPRNISVHQSLNDTLWISLLKDDLYKNWRGYNLDSIPPNWKLVEGELTAAGSGVDIITKKMYSNFELAFEYKISPGGNSGVFFNVREGKEFDKIWRTGIEMQITDNRLNPQGQIPKNSAGSVFALYAPGRDVTRPAGEWNTAMIKVENGKVEYRINGILINSFELWTEKWYADREETLHNSTRKPFWGEFRSGHIALQDEGFKVAYRNIYIKELK
jgi:hypothetical protein